ncbi:MAG TPA: hypothetical protein VNA89_11180 [Gemmatimonadaceae bacterium]|nr:hypothetical protein [Gemmatimonadaceae bacterium]
MRRLALLALLAAPVAARAQGTLSAQGFGYTPGQLGARSRAMGGGDAELDPISPLNPAALIAARRSTLYFEVAPEVRQVDVAGEPSRTQLIRFPVFGAAIQAGARTMIGIGASTLADRTWGTSYTFDQQIGGEAITTTERFRSTGALNDVRLGVGYALTPGLWVGAGAHVITGQNRIVQARSFDDSRFLPYEERATLAFTGAAFSAGVAWRPLRAVAVAASGRKGTKLTARVADTVVGRGDVPDRAGVGVRFDGFRGATLAARYDWTGWSSVDPIGTASLASRDTREYGAGAEILGPRFAGTAVQLRLGGRRRELPFALAGAEIRETILGGGLGIPVARERAALDWSLERATRSGEGVSARERAWLVGFGFTMRF